MIKQPFKARVVLVGQDDREVAAVVFAIMPDSVKEDGARWRQALAADEVPMKRTIAADLLRDTRRKGFMPLHGPRSYAALMTGLIKEKYAESMAGGAP